MNKTNAQAEEEKEKKRKNLMNMFSRDLLEFAKENNVLGQFRQFLLDRLPEGAPHHVSHKQKKELEKQAIGRWRNKSTSKCFQAWLRMVEMSRALKEDRARLDTLLEDLKEVEESGTVQIDDLRQDVKEVEESTTVQEALDLLKDDDAAPPAATHATHFSNEIHKAMTTSNEGTDVTNRTILHDWLGILYSFIYLWVTIMYLVRLTPTGSQVLCKSGQIVLLPLFKPAALSLWPALMPMVQMVYWLSVSERAATMGPNAYVGIISPGKRPFELNVLTLIHAWLLSVPLLVYILATIFFAPLVLLFGIFLYRKVDGVFFYFCCFVRSFFFLVGSDLVPYFCCCSFLSLLFS